VKESVVNPSTRRHRALAMFGLLGTAVGAHASCGSAYCSLLNDRFALGTWDHVGWSADFRIESVTQDRLHQGAHSVTAAAVTGEEAIERHTRNTNLVTTLERSFDLNWSVTLRVPVVRRDHLHDLLDDTTGAIGPSEHWRFARLGDVQLLARWQDARDAPDSSWAVTAGLKLPTGSKTVANDDGRRAERALQPGSGTTDLVLGVASRHMVADTNALNLQATWTQALNTSEQFKPGRRIELAAGWAHAYNSTVSAVLQANLVHKARDSGNQAEPDNSGSTTLSLSPGLSVATSAKGIVYAFVQLPVYQKVNGIQLVPKTSLAVGYTTSY
jgi:hypothetical protein